MTWYFYLSLALVKYELEKSKQLGIFNALSGSLKYYLRSRSLAQNRLAIINKKKKQIQKTGFAHKKSNTSDPSEFISTLTFNLN